MLEQVALMGGSAILAVIVMEVFNLGEGHRKPKIDPVGKNFVKITDDYMGKDDCVTIKYGGPPSRHDIMYVTRGPSGKKVAYDLETGHSRQLARETAELTMDTHEASREGGFGAVAKYLSDHKGVVEDVVKIARNEIEHGQITPITRPRPRARA